MERDITAALAAWLAAGRRQVGQALIVETDGRFELRHADDRDRDDLVFHEGPQAARFLAQFDDASVFRPLKTAPNLRHGWRLALASLDELHRALDYLYPAMLGVWVSHELGVLRPVCLRETLGRQTGMYRVTQKITDAAADNLIGNFCRTDGGCLKTILWQIAPEVPLTHLPAVKFDPTIAQATADTAGLPLLCHEPCNLLVAAVRSEVKRSSSPNS